MRAPVSLLISHYTLSIAMYRVGSTRQSIHRFSYSRHFRFEFSTTKSEDLSETVQSRVSRELPSVYLLLITITGPFNRNYFGLLIVRASFIERIDQWLLRIRHQLAPTCLDRRKSKWTLTTTSFSRYVLCRVTNIILEKSHFAHRRSF